MPLPLSVHEWNLNTNKYSYHNMIASEFVFLSLFSNMMELSIILP